MCLLGHALGVARLFSHSLINVEAVLVNLPGDSLVNAGQGMSSRFSVNSTGFLGRGVASVKLSKASVLPHGTISDSVNSPRARARAAIVRQRRRQ